MGTLDQLLAMHEVSQLLIINMNAKYNICICGPLCLVQALVRCVFQA